MTITFEHSVAWLLLLVPLAALIAWWVYWFRSGRSDWSTVLRSTLWGLRFLVFAVLFALLLKPFIIIESVITERPKLLLVQDKSASVSTQEQAFIANWWSAHQAELSEQFEPAMLLLGGEVVDENGNDGLDTLHTNYQQLQAHIADRYYRQNIGAVVVASDGLFNEGADPRYASHALGAPLMTVAMGDTTAVSDLSVNELLVNKLVFLGNELEVKARIAAEKMRGHTTQVQLMHAGEVVDEVAWNVTSSSEAKEVTFRWKATKPGLNQLAVKIPVATNELNDLNNQQSVFVDVIDNRTRVAVVSNAPHPDVAALVQSIARNEQYEVEVIIANDWKPSATAFDLHIFHDMPANNVQFEQLKAWKQGNAPYWLIVGQQVNLSLYNALETGVNISASRGAQDEVSGALNNEFNTYNLPEYKGLDRFPPMLVPFGDVNTDGDVRIGLYQKVGAIRTDKPLLAVTERGGQKHGILLGEGIWRWRLYDRMNLEGTWVENLISKTVQYLAIRQKRTRLLVEAPETVSEADPVVFFAEYYDKAYELNQSADVKLQITDSANRVSEFRFQPNAKGFRIDVGSMIPGSYDWQVTASNDEGQFKQEGTLEVNRDISEYVQTRANHQLLAQWANTEGGEMYLPSEGASLVQKLLQLETAKPTLHSSTDWEELITWKWLAFFVILLLSFEWILRKYHGAY